MGLFTELNGRCPFCGGEARLFVNDGVRVLCTKCRASSKILVDSECYKTGAVEKVIEAWNRRVNNDEVSERREGVRRYRRTAA